MLEFSKVPPIPKPSKEAARMSELRVVADGAGLRVCSDGVEVEDDG